jgi:cell division protein FtsN
MSATKEKEKKKKDKTSKQKHLLEQKRTDICNHAKKLNSSIEQNIKNKPQIQRHFPQITYLEAVTYVV